MTVIEVGGKQEALDSRLVRRFIHVMRMCVVTEVRALPGRRLFMLAIAGRSCPGELGHHQQGEEENDATAHGKKYIDGLSDKLNLKHERAAIGGR